MFKKHPKGLLPAILVNMFARFAFFVVVTNLLLFFNAKFTFLGENAIVVYSIFYFSIFVFSCVGGIIADKKRDYKGTVFKGLLVMIIGCFAIVIATSLAYSWAIFVFTCFALLFIAFGEGLFNGNLYAMIGQMYDKPNYSQMRDSGFLLSTLFVNIGSLVATLAIREIQNAWIAHKGFVYDANFLSLCFEYTDNSENTTTSNFIQDMATKAGQGTMELSEFVNQYLQAFSAGFSFVFSLAFIALITSLIFFFLNKEKFPIPEKIENQSLKMDVKLLRKRMYAFLAIFCILNLFYFASHQDGFALSLFTRDYAESQYFNFNISWIQVINATFEFSKLSKKTLLGVL